MTELYKAAFAYETDKEDELSLKVGETVRISNKDSPDWWLAERIDNNKEFGLVPSNFLEKIPVKEGIILAIVTKDYLAQSPEELSLQKNRIVTILEKDVGEGWWKGDLNGKTGLFPADHVELVEEGEHPEDNDSKSKKDAFKLAAYGVKQGGIGSILAGGFSLKRSSTSARSSMNERPTSTNSTSHPETSAPSIPNKPHPTIAKPVEQVAAPTKKGTMSSRAMVLHDYAPESEDEIKLMRGEYVTVIDQLENDGWWKGTSESGETGVFPSNFVQILEEDKPPQRPVRARPATVKTEAPVVAAPPESMARPPPVPVTTRPTSLLSQREGSSLGSPPPRPTTTPPRPITSPPVPSTRRTNSIVSPPPIEIGHRRIPSIPLTSPDLPPMSPGFERPTRPIPRPTSTISSDLYGARSPEAHQNALNHMAKPPKMNFGAKAPHAVPPSPSTSRPVSTNDEVIPPVPKRSMPPLPEKTILPNNFDQSQVPEKKTPPHRNIALPSTPDPLDMKIRQLIKVETDKIRQEFENKLEQERMERQRIQDELDELKASLV
ncbi:SH3 domain-containing protein [Mucor mucedo]|uniref:SH3 domain-containing protein n=1 Tax=Mucor mucedo TaxID=29922 RepID=UPI00222082E6|nr:SH3 domain-containing protein [Mucor mucedo]KAI7890299.1 SH3 domain-containing protein [Mucor mucedo]